MSQSAYLSILINLRVGIIRNNGRIEEVEEAVGLDLLGDGSDASLGLVFLLLLHLLHRQVLTLLPVDGAAGAFDDLGSLGSDK